ncbi:MAG TPA: SIS domain-containing protein [Blastocatellia bacterium]|nr:SIS domain-containing protein [Blastocatellia bacterium]
MATRRERDSLNAVSVHSSEIEKEAARAINRRGSLPPASGSCEKGTNGNGHAANGRSASAQPKKDKSPSHAVEEFFDLAQKELAALRTRAEVDAIERAAELILECEAHGGRVHVTGIGKSEYVARYIASLLSSTGTPAYFLHATECVHGSAGQVCSPDITIAISNSGTTAELMSAVEALRDLGIKIIGVSGNTESPLALAADVLLYAGVDNEGGDLNLVPRASILAKIFVLCALSVALEARKGLTREQYARWHPGGKLGKLARGD